MGDVKWECQGHFYRDEQDERDGQDIFLIGRGFG